MSDPDKASVNVPKPDETASRPKNPHTAKEEQTPTSEPNANEVTKRSSRGTIIALIILLVVIAGAVIWASTQSNTAPTAISSTQTTSTNASSTTSQTSKASRKLIDATVYTKDNEATRFTSIANGKPLVINFWATWCPYCVQEMDDFQALVDKYGEHINFAFVDAADGQRETVEAASVFLQEHGYNLPDYYDTSQEAISLYGVTALPATIIADKDGTVVYARPGAIDQQEINAILATL